MTSSEPLIEPEVTPCATPPAPRGFIAQLAQGLAGAIVSSPGFTASAPLASTLWFHGSWFTIGLAHLAGIGLSRVRPSSPSIQLLLWTSLAVFQWLTRSSRTSGHPRAEVAPSTTLDSTQRANPGAHR